MENYYELLKRSPLVRMCMPWENFTRASPLLWIFLASLLILFIGIGFPYLKVFAWIGGFLILLFVAAAITIFEGL